MLRWILCVLLVFPCLPAQALPRDSLLDAVKRAIERTATYDSAKIDQIHALRQLLRQNGESDLAIRYQLSQQLFEAFEVFHFDSAFVYAQKTLSLAQRGGDPEYIASARINFGSIMVAAGMYQEAQDTLLAIDAQSLPRARRAIYFGQLGRCYGEMAEYSGLPFFSQGYEAEANRFRDSALMLTEAGTFFHQFLLGFLAIERGNTQQGAQRLQQLLADAPLGPREEALVHYILGDIAQQAGQIDTAIFHFSHSAILDIQTSAKETLAMLKLATLLFQQGETRYASPFIQKANADARFYGARQRQIQVANILPFIEEKVIQTIEAQKQRLLGYVVSISMLLAFVLGLAIVIYRQMGNLRKARNQIEASHRAQQEVNRQLRAANHRQEETNHRLAEASRIKEEYVGFLFTLDSQLFEKFGRIKLELEKQAHEGSLPGLRQVIRRIDLKKEKQSLLENFDATFIKLFPHFVPAFNSLFTPENQVPLKPGEPLNTELRIFALIRLGITDNDKIAQILGYSVNTIYMYKTKVRNRSWVKNEAFDQKLWQITHLGADKEEGTG